MFNGLEFEKKILKELEKSSIKTYINHKSFNFPKNMIFKGYLTYDKLTKKINSYKEYFNVVEFCRSLTLNITNQLILKYGQDLKNEQWILEPFADLIISFSIVMYACFLMTKTNLAS